MTVHDERAVRGAALLDERLPGWRTQVNPATLYLQWCSTCVLGQLFGDYTRGIEALGLTNTEAVQYGFDATANTPTLWSRLTWAWRKVLA